MQQRIDIPGLPVTGACRRNFGGSWTAIHVAARAVGVTHPGGEVPWTRPSSPIAHRPPRVLYRFRRRPCRLGWDAAPHDATGGTPESPTPGFPGRFSPPHQKKRPGFSLDHPRPWPILAHVSGRSSTTKSVFPGGVERRAVEVPLTGHTSLTQVRRLPFNVPGEFREGVVHPGGEVPLAGHTSLAHVRRHCYGVPGFATKRPGLHLRCSAAASPQLALCGAVDGSGWLAGSRSSIPRDPVAATLRQAVQDLPSGPSPALFLLGFSRTPRNIFVDPCRQ